MAHDAPAQTNGDDLPPVYTVIIAIPSSAIYSVVTPIRKATRLSLSDINNGTGIMFLFYGWGCLIWQPFALQYGKRPAYLASLIANIYSIFNGITLVYYFLFIEETNYNRPARPIKDSTSTGHTTGVREQHNGSDADKKSSDKADEKNITNAKPVNTETGQMIYPRKTYIQKLSIKDKARPNRMLDIALSRLRGFTYPSVVYAGGYYCGKIGLVISQFTLAINNALAVAGSLRYAIASYPQLSSDIITTYVIIRNTMSFTINYRITPWLNHIGYRDTYIIVAAIGFVWNASIFVMTKYSRTIRENSANRY
ncbi:hypothetical protein CSPX01_07232 [Colletotrichum filicis]|nr:hypothetical protein CSPX01_07232 [Colletotrichum filicis]